MTEKHTVKIRVFTEHRMLRIRISGITSGFVTHTQDDDSAIEFKLDQSRFHLELIFGSRVIFKST